MKTAACSESPSEDPILLYRPVTVQQLAEALNQKPFRILAALMEIDNFSTLRYELDDETVARLAELRGFTYRIVDGM
jgi:hypothetical protein